MTKAFSSALIENEELENGTEYPLSVELDDYKLRFRRPTTGEFVALTSALSNFNSDFTKFAALLNMLEKVLHPADAQWFGNRLLDPTDPLSRTAPRVLAGDDNHDGLLHEVVREWSARPTESANPSSDTQTKPGSDSTPGILASTSSSSPSASS